VSAPPSRDESASPAHSGNLVWGVFLWAGGLVGARGGTRPGRRVKFVFFLRGENQLAQMCAPRRGGVGYASSGLCLGKWPPGPMILARGVVSPAGTASTFFPTRPPRRPRERRRLQVNQGRQTAHPPADKGPRGASADSVGRGEAPETGGGGGRLAGKRGCSSGISGVPPCIRWPSWGTGFQGGGGGG